MAEVEMSDIESTSGMLEQLCKAFHGLESHKQSAMHNQTKWEDVKECFLSFQTLLKEKFAELEEKEKAFTEKQCENNVLVSEREVAVAANEQIILDRLQQLKDSAVSAISKARNRYNVAPPELVDLGASKGNKVSNSTKVDTNVLVSTPEDNLPGTESGKPVDFAATQINPRTELTPAELEATQTNPRPELTKLCERMDVNGLLKFLSENRKHLIFLRQELSHALKSAKEPSRLVLDCLEGFYPPDLLNSKENDIVALQDLRRTCILLMESVAFLWGPTEPDAHHPVSSEIKELAKAIAIEWKANLAFVDLDHANGSSLEAQAFLQLLASFSIASDFDEDELCKLVLAFSRRRQAPELCRSLGLAHKMPGVAEALISNGRHIDAFHFVHVFELTESFPSVPLLKAYLDDTIKKEQEKNETAKLTGSTKVTINNKEMGALRTIIKCIKEYRIQNEFPIDPLRKRISELTDRTRTEKKGPSEEARPQPKRPRVDAGYAPRRPVMHNRQPPSMSYHQRGAFTGAAAERYPYTKTTPPATYSSQHASSQRAYPYADNRTPRAPYGYGFDYGSYASSGVQQPTSSNYGTYRPPEATPTLSNYTSSNYGNYRPAEATPTSSNYTSSSYGNYRPAEAPPPQQTPPANYGSYMSSMQQSSYQSYL